MGRQEVEQTVIECVAESLVVDSAGIHNKSLLINELGADSLDFMDIMFHLEDAFEIKLQKENLDFISQIEIDRDKAVVDNHLTTTAKQQLTYWMPDLDVNKELKVNDLVNYLSIESLVIVIEVVLQEKIQTTTLGAENV